MVVPPLVDRLVAAIPFAAIVDSLDGARPAGKTAAVLPLRAHAQVMLQADAVAVFGSRTGHLRQC
jgi:hypothetical protein